jgi:hypothetical protein
MMTHNLVSYLSVTTTVAVLLILARRLPARDRALTAVQCEALHHLRLRDQPLDLDMVRAL